MSAVSQQLSSRVVESCPPAGDLRALAGQRVGSLGTITGFDPQLAQPSARRFFDLGFTPGTEIEVLRRAPLGGPIVVRVADTEIAVRRADATHILISPRQSLMR